jgi:signal transduction histidine kinase
MAFLEGKSIPGRERIEMEKRILIVDDEKEIGVLLYQALSRMGGFYVEVVESGEEALQKIEKEPFDLVLTDLKMPKMDGLQLVKEIAQAKPEILTVLMSGHGSIDSALEAMKKGASDYLTKPLNLDELVIRLCKVLDEKQRFLSLKDYAYELERANKELRKIDEIKSEFVSVASHELRTPLAAIKNAVQLMMSGKTGEINENQAKFLSMAERNINRLTNILNDLLDLSRIESGKIDIKFEELDVRIPIEFVASTLKPQADAKSIQIVVEVTQHLPAVYGDQEKIEQILTNLIGNAIKFTPEGGKVVVSTQPLDAQERKLAISVRDTGIGIPKDQLEKIFEKFHQVEGSLHRLVSGTGLGLAITKGLVEANYGTIWVESEVGKGSVFTFTLPMSKGERRDLRFRSMLDREFQRAKENQSPLTLFLIEIREEKVDVKDTLLDQLEVQVKQCLCRKGDITLRRQKEKILAVLCEADLKGAQAVCQRIEREIKKCAMNWGDQSPIIKVGMATYPAEAFSKRELFRLAKERLGG